MFTVMSDTFLGGLMQAYVTRNIESFSTILTSILQSFRLEYCFHPQQVDRHESIILLSKSISLFLTRNAN